LFRRLLVRIKTLWSLAKNERASPKELAWAIALGVFAGCTPAVGVHGWVALGLATLFRKNRLFCWIGSRISNFLILPWIVIAEVQLSHRLRTGSFVELHESDALEKAPALILDWILGSIPVGIALGALLGILAFYGFRFRDRRRAAREAREAKEREKDEATRSPAEAP
jgi:uncharacterized protein (DUF2062 family)